MAVRLALRGRPLRVGLGAVGEHERVERGEREQPVVAAREVVALERGQRDLDAGVGVAPVYARHSPAIAAIRLTPSVEPGGGGTKWSASTVRSAGDPTPNQRMIISNANRPRRSSASSSGRSPAARPANAAASSARSVNTSAWTSAFATQRPHAGDRRASRTPP